jgi:hypothetical protein
LRVLFVPVVLVVTSLAVVGLTGTGGDPALGRAVETGRPVQLCLAADAPGVGDVFLGRRRAVLAVHFYDPAADGGGFLEVTLAATGESTQIGFFPGGPFRSESRAEAQRFFLPSPEGAAAAELCYTVALIGGDGAAAQVSLELSDELPR